MRHPHDLREIQHGVDGRDAPHMRFRPRYHRPEEAELALREVWIYLFPELLRGVPVTFFDLFGEADLALLLAEVDRLLQLRYLIFGEKLSIAPVRQDFGAPVEHEHEPVADACAELLFGQVL